MSTAIRLLPALALCCFAGACAADDWYVDAGIGFPNLPPLQGAANAAALSHASAGSTASTTETGPLAVILSYGNWLEETSGMEVALTYFGGPEGVTGLNQNGATFDGYTAWGYNVSAAAVFRPERDSSLSVKAGMRYSRMTLSTDGFSVLTMGKQSVGVSSVGFVAGIKVRLLDNTGSGYPPICLEAEVYSHLKTPALSYPYLSRDNAATHNVASVNLLFELR